MHPKQANDRNVEWCFRSEVSDRYLWNANAGVEKYILIHEETVLMEEWACCSCDFDYKNMILLRLRL